MVDDTFSSSDWPFQTIDYDKYVKCHCGADCDHKDNSDDQPCWGEVSPLGMSGDSDFGHFCEGHALLHYGERYKGKPE